MHESEIKSPADLELALTAGAIRRRRQLWKLAEGRVVRRTDVVGVLLALALIAVGAAAVFDEHTGMIQVVFGLFMASSIGWMHTQRQVNALAAIVRRLESEATSPAAHS